MSRVYLGTIVLPWGKGYNALLHGWRVFATERKKMPLNLAKKKKHLSLLLDSLYINLANLFSYIKYMKTTTK